jgi:hypothetical protein
MPVMGGMYDGRGMETYLTQESGCHPERGRQQRAEDGHDPAACTCILQDRACDQSTVCGPSLGKLVVPRVRAAEGGDGRTVFGRKSVGLRDPWNGEAAKTGISFGG